MNTDNLGTPSFDWRSQFHSQTQRLYFETVEIASKDPSCSLPVPRDVIEQSKKLIEVYNQLSAKRDELAHFAEFFRDRCCLLPIFKWTSLHEAAIHESGQFLLDFLGRDRSAAGRLANRLVAAGVPIDQTKSMHLCDLRANRRVCQKLNRCLVDLRDNRHAFRTLNSLEKRFVDLTSGRYSVEQDKYPIIRGNCTAKFARELNREFERCQKFVAAEPGVRWTAATDPTEELLTIKDIAKMADAQVQTVYNKLSKSAKEGCAPIAAVKGQGRQRDKFKYSEILPWLRKNFPRGSFPDSSGKAAVMDTRKALQKVSSS